MTSVTALRIAALLILIGLVLTLIGQFHLAPATFLAVVMVGFPCMGAGAVIYIVHVLRTLKKTGAL